MLQLELKRIFSKKINVFAIILAFILAGVFSGFAVTSNRYVDEKGKISTGVLAARKLTANRAPWNGTLTTEKLSEVMKQIRESISKSMEEQDAKFGTTLQPLDEIKSFLISVLTPEQKAYLEKQYGKIKLPVTYEAFTSWDTMIMYAETYSIILAIIVGFICAGIFADDFQTKADAVFFAAKYGRTKAVKIKILAGLVTTTALYWSGMALLSIICFGIMGVSGANTPYTAGLSKLWKIRKRSWMKSMIQGSCFSKVLEWTKISRQTRHTVDMFLGV